MPAYWPQAYLQIASPLLSGSAATYWHSLHACVYMHACSKRKQPFRLQYGAWMTTGDVQCPSPQNCLGCCYSYPSVGECSGCEHRRDVIVQCGKFSEHNEHGWTIIDYTTIYTHAVFDPTKAKLGTGTAGSQDKCQFNSKKKIEHCESGLLITTLHRIPAFP